MDVGRIDPVTNRSCVIQEVPIGAQFPGRRHIESKMICSLGTTNLG